MLNATELQNIATNANISVDELERQIAEYGNYIDTDTDDFGWNHDAVAKIIGESLKAKEESGLLPMLRKHPDYHEEIKSVVIKGYIPKEIDTATINHFCSTFDNWVLGKYRDIHDSSRYMPNFFYDWLRTLFSYLAYAYNKDDTVLSEESISNIKRTAELLDYVPAIPVDSSKLPFTVGMKRTRAIGKYLDMLGLKEYAKGLPMTVQHGLSCTVETNEYDVWFAKYGDAISTKGKEVYYVISAYPLDFIRSSCGGKYGWSSCHNPLRDRHSGCNCSGGISYGLDDVTLEVYTIPVSVGCEISELPLQDKLARCMVHFGEGFKYFIADGVYPNKRLDENEAFRNIAQGVVAESLGVENLWRIRKDYLEYPCNYASLEDGATCYPDFMSPRSNKGSLSYLSAFPADDIETIYIGAKPISTTTGWRHSTDNNIEGYAYICENCGDKIYDRDEDEVYSDYHHEYGCVNCMRYSDYDNDWYYNDEIVGDVIGYHGTVSIYSLEESGYFTQCDDCGEWCYDDEINFCEEDCTYICNHCLRRSDEYARCWDCGEVHRIEEMVCYDGNYYCEDCVTTCSECGQVIPNHLTVRRESDGNRICMECFEKPEDETCEESGIAMAS